MAPGDAVPLDLLWQAVEPPGEPLVIVIQLLGRDGRVAAGLEAQPVGGRYPTQGWAAGELVRDRHQLTVPEEAAPGEYRLVVGVYRASNQARLRMRAGPFSAGDIATVNTLVVRPP